MKYQVKIKSFNDSDKDKKKIIYSIYLYWYVNENLVPKMPDINMYGSKVVHRIRAHNGLMDKDVDFALLGHMLDKIIHRDKWDNDALFVMVDPVIPSVKNAEGGAGNGIISISYGDEEFMTGKILNRFNHLYTQYSVTDIPSDPRRNFGSFLECFSNNPEYSQSVTNLEGWKRTVTLYKTGDRRIEVKDSLPREGNVYWHLQGTPIRETDKITLDVRGTKMEVSYKGHSKMLYHENDTWAQQDSLLRWGYTGNPDRQIKLYRSTPGTIITTFRPVLRK